MSSIWVIVECFVVVKYLLSLNVCTVTFLIAYVLFSTSVKLFSHRISLILAVWSAIMASTFFSVLPLTLRVDCFPTDNTLALTFIAWKSEMSPVSLMENVWENVIVRSCSWCYARFFLYSIFLLRCAAPGNRGLDIMNLVCYLLLLCFLQFSTFFRRITDSSHNFWWW